jgi:hypothetical protein
MSAACAAVENVSAVASVAAVVFWKCHLSFPFGFSP